jgi:hypothetical protein
VFVEPNRITRKIVVLEPQDVWVADVLKAERKEEAEAAAETVKVAQTSRPAER